MATRVGRPKHRRPHDIPLTLPKNPIRYEAKHLYWALMEMEVKMSKDITSVKMSEYTQLLSAYVEKTKLLAKQGITYGTSTKVKKRMEQRGLAQDESNGSTAGVSQDGLSSVGVGVSAFNPLA